MTLISSTAARSRLATALMLASGFAGLGYQIIWTQEFALCLGTESASVLAVVAAFFAGLAGCASVVVLSWISILKEGFSDDDE